MALTSKTLSVPVRETISMDGLDKSVVPPGSNGSCSFVPDRKTMSEQALSRKRRLKKPKFVFVRGDTKDELYPFVKRMASSTNVHGMKEMCTAKTVQARMFWITVCILCAVMASYEIVMIVRQFRNDRIATKISFEPQDSMQYPVVLFCPTQWVSASRVNKLKIPLRSLKYAVHFLGDALATTEDHEHEHGPYNHEIENEILKQVLKQKNFDTVADMFLNISLNFGYSAPGRMTRIHCTCCNRRKPIVTLAGVCAVIELCSSSFQTDNLPVILYLESSDIVPNVSTPFGDGKEDGAYLWIFDNQSDIGVLAHNSIFVESERLTIVKLSYTHVSRLSIGSGKKQCKDIRSDERYEPITYCEQKCVDKYKNQLCRRCSKFSFFDKNMNASQCAKFPVGFERNELGLHCSEQTEEGRKLAEYVRKHMKTCKDLCIAPCQQSIYKVMSLQKMKTEQELIQVRFYFESFGATVMRDVETLTIDTLISSIGGQTGLWLGASVVSLCQLISYCCCPCLHWKNLKGGYNSFRSTFRAKKKKPKTSAENDFSCV